MRAPRNRQRAAAYRLVRVGGASLQRLWESAEERHESVLPRGRACGIDGEAFRGEVCGLRRL
jgi:hypothetical protein